MDNYNTNSFSSDMKLFLNLNFALVLRALEAGTAARLRGETVVHDISG